MNFDEMTYEDYLNEDERIGIERDKRYAAYEAGFEKAKEIYSTPGLLARITDPVYHFDLWREAQDAGSQRVDL